MCVCECVCVCPYAACITHTSALVSLFVHEPFSPPSSPAAAAAAAADDAAAVKAGALRCCWLRPSPPRVAEEEGKADGGGRGEGELCNTSNP